MEMCRLLPMVLLVCSFATQQPIDDKGCIVVIGGEDKGGKGVGGFELYHPEDNVTCDTVYVDDTRYLKKTISTSGCYTPNEHQIVTRETNYQGNAASPMLYKLAKGEKGGGVLTTLPLTDYITGSSSAWLEASSKCISCGGYVGPTPSAKCYEYSSAGSRKWEEMTPLPNKVKYPSVVAVGSQIYVIGLFDGKKVTQVYHYTNDTWTNTGKLNSYEYEHSAAALSINEFIDCPHSGGGLQSCQVYNVDNDKPEEKGKLHKTSDGLGSRLVNFDGDVYAVGGTDNKVEVYNSKTGTWTAVKKGLSEIRRWPVVVAIQPKIATTPSSITTNDPMDARQDSTEMTTTPSTGLSAGLIAVLIIVPILIIVLVALGVGGFLLYRKRKKAKKEKQEKEQAAKEEPLAAGTRTARDPDHPGSGYLDMVETKEHFVDGLSNYQSQLETESGEEPVQQPGKGLKADGEKGGGVKTDEKKDY